jgi:hypothetical protein
MGRVENVPPVPGCGFVVGLRSVAFLLDFFRVFLSPPWVLENGCCQLLKVLKASGPSLYSGVFVERSLASEKEHSLWPIAILGALVAFLSLFTSKRSQTGKSVPTQNTARHQSNNRPIQVSIVAESKPAPPAEPYSDTRKDNTPLWKKILEWGALLTAIGLLVVNIFQMMATQDAVTKAGEANNLTRRSLESVQRAFIISHGIKKKMIVVKNTSGNTTKSFEFTTQWENAGNTPAVGVIMAFGVVEKIDELTEPEFMATRIDRAVLKAASSAIGPKSTVDSGVARQLEDFPDVPRFFWGWLVYRDTFPNTEPHVTEFCLKTTKIQPHQPPDGDYTFDATVCSHHNCVDEFCEDYTAMTQLFSRRN